MEQRRPSERDWVGEIRSQPAILHHVADVFTGEERGALSAARTWFWHGEHHLIVFTGTGSSLYAAQAVVPSLNRIGVRAVAIDASELLHHGVPALAGKVAVVVVSQSGESEEAAALMRALKTRVNTLAIVCAPSSSLATSADLVVDVPVAVDSGISVRTYTATVAVLLLLAHVVAGGVVDRAAALLHAAADGAERLLRRESIHDVLPEPAAGPIYLVGSGPSLASAQEGALLLQRLAARAAEGLSPGQFRRGAIDTVDSTGTVVLFAPQGPALPDLRALASLLAAYDVPITIISNARPGIFPESARLISVQYPDDSFAPLVETVPIQLSASRLSPRGRGASRVSGEE